MKLITVAILAVLSACEMSPDAQRAYTEKRLKTQSKFWEKRIKKWNP